MPTNAELIQMAHDQELEGAETATVTQAVVDFIATSKADFQAQLAAAQAQIDALTAEQLPAAARDEITTALTNAKGSFDNVQAVLTAIVTPPADPIPEPTPEPTPEPMARRRR